MTKKKIGTPIPPLLPIGTHTHAHAFTCCLTFSCVLLMEDFSDHTVFYFDHDQERLPSEYFMAAVEGIAEFHAEWMNHPLFKDKTLAWLNNTTVCDWTSQRSSPPFQPPPPPPTPIIFSKQDLIAHETIRRDADKRGVFS